MLSVRQLADYYQVNINTVQRSVSELKIMGVVVKGKMCNYVVPDSKIIEGIKTDYIKMEDECLMIKERIGVK